MGKKPDKIIFLFETSSTRLFSEFFVQINKEKLNNFRQLCHIFG